MVTRKAQGRPVKWSAKTLAPLFADMSEYGESLLALCRKQGVSYSAVYQAIARDDDLTQMYARAREDYLHTRVAQMDEIAQTEEDIQRAKLRCDNIKWEASRVLPKSYGDKQSHEVSGPQGKPVPIQVIVEPVAPGQA